jgi:acyl-CoA synthetase (AMP-forming)/AMP-acid ligase II
MAAQFGGTVVLEKSFAYPFAIIERLREERATGFPIVPTMSAILLQMKEIGPEVFDGVRYISNTAAALPEKHIRGLRKLFRNADIYSMYGLTECKRVTYLPPEDIDRKPGSVGRGMPNEQVYLVDDSGRTIEEPDTVGELVVRGANVMQGYWELPGETAERLKPGRYPWERVLHTGDLFTMDAEGYLYFVSRKDDIIKSRGEKVSPKEIEVLLCDHEDIVEAAVVGVPDEVLGEAIRAYVVLREGSAMTEKEILGYCSRNLEDFMKPQSAVIVASLPKTTSGKITKKGL